MFKKINLLFLILCSISFASTSSIYQKLQLENKIDYKVFNDAMKGTKKLKKENLNYLVIIDLTKTSNLPRFTMIDLKKTEIVYHTYVAHGKNTGKSKAVKFSNSPNSFQSSLGFYLTGEAYTGIQGYSLKLFGLEENFNSNAFDRGIVIHGSEYATEEYLKQFGFLGRTEGCPAISSKISKKVIDLLASGKSVVYIAGNDEKYLEKSKYIN